MLVVKNIMAPLLIILLLLWFAWFVADSLFKILNFDHFIPKLIVMVVIWHFGGNLLYDFINTSLITENVKIIEIIYKPIYFIISLF